MATIPAKVANRLAKGLKHFQSVVNQAHRQDKNESDTAVIVTDMLADLFGYDKYGEITAEYAIRGTYCDRAIRIQDKIQLLIEVKAVGLDLKDAHIKQAVDYAANQGVEWVVLTNAKTWRIFHIVFDKPIDHELILEFDILELNARTSSHLESLYLLSREALIKSALDEYHMQRQATNRFFLAAVLLSDPVLDVIRRELRRLSPGTKVDAADIRNALTQEVLKREVVEGDKAVEARKKVQRALGKSQRNKRTKAAASPTEVGSSG